MSKNYQSWIRIEVANVLNAHNNITLSETKLWMKDITVRSPLKLETRAGDSNDCITDIATTRTSIMMMKISV
jgi:hypothetical protein